MNKILTGLLFAATLLFSFTASAGCSCKPRWGYFYTSAYGDVEGAIIGPNDSINWGYGGNSTSDGIFLSSSDTTQIVIEHSGVYLVTYSILGLLYISPFTYPIEFALYLNEGLTPVPGSVYSVYNADVGDGDTQLFGQAIVRVTERNSCLQLVNTSVVIGDVQLYNEYNDNAVTASLMINRIDPHQ